MPMRILHVAEAFGGGLYEICRIQAEGAAAAGHEVAIAYGRRPETPADVRAEVAPNVQLFETPWVDRSPGTQVRAVRYLRGLVRHWKPDVVHLQSSFAGLHGAVAVADWVPCVYSP